MAGCQDRRLATRYLMDLINDVGLSYTQDVVVAFQRQGVVLKFLASEVRFAQRVPLDHGPHPAIQDHDPLPQDGLDLGLQGSLHARFKEREGVTFKK